MLIYLIGCGNAPDFVMKRKSKMKDKKVIQPPENKMGVMSTGKLLFSMAVPMMLSMLVQAFYNIVDSVFVSQISENALTAVSLAFPLQNLMIACGAGTAVGINALLSRSLGAKKQDEADRTANAGIFMSLCCGALFALVGIFLTKPFFMVQTDNAEIIQFGTDYASICLGFSFGIFSQFCFERLLQSTGRTIHATITQLIGAVINIILDPILIFGYLGMPAMGVKGAAVATVTGQIIAAIVAVIMNIKFNPDVHIRLREIRWHTETVKGIYKVGFPSIIMQSIGSIMTFGLNSILLGFSDTAAAVFGAYFKLQSFIFMPIFGLNNGMVPIIAFNYGAKKPDRVKSTIRLTIISAVCIMLAGLTVFEAIPHVLLGFFNASEEMLAIGVPALRTIAFHFCLAGFCIIAGSVCQAIGNPFYSLVVSVCRQLLVLLPAAWLLSLTGKLALVWLAFPIAEVFSLTLSAIFLKKTMKKANRIMNEE